MTDESASSKPNPAKRPPEVPATPESTLTGTGAPPPEMVAPLHEGTLEALAKLDAINTRIRNYDESLRSRAADLLLKTEFGTVSVEFKHLGHGRLVAGSSTPENKAMATPIAGQFSDLVERWRPDSQSEWVLLAAYYVSRVEGEVNLTGHMINKVLRHHGTRVLNVTRAIQACVTSNPATMLQIKKSGSTKQSRKLYRITTQGTKQVEEKLGILVGAAGALAQGGLPNSP